MTSTLHRRPVRPPGPGYSALTSIRTIRRMGPNHFFESIRREYPRLAFVKFWSEPAYLVFTPDLVRTVLVDSRIEPERLSRPAGLALRKANTTIIVRKDGQEA